MPYDEKFLDEYEIAFVEATHAAGFLCERLDFQHFTGDIFTEIESRIRSASGVIALLNDHNPNVFLEIGYALAVKTPVVFVVRDGEDVPFDIQSHRHLRYASIHALRRDLTETLTALSRSGSI